MPADISAALKELTRSAGELNDLTDETSRAVHRVEAALNSISVGIPCAIAIDEAVLEGRKRKTSSAYYRLAYRRNGKNQGFRIVVECVNNDIVTWDELSREMKLRAIRFLPSLVRLISEEVATRVDAAKLALKEVDGLLHSTEMED